MTMGSRESASSGRRALGPSWPVFGSVLIGLVFVAAGFGVMRTMM